MEYIKIEIPAPDFSFEEIAKDKADDIMTHILYPRALYQFAAGGNSDLLNRLVIEITTDLSISERLICIANLLSLLTEANKEIYRNIHLSVDDKARCGNAINKIKYKLYSLAKDDGYNFDKNTFTDDEVYDLSNRVDTILEKLNEIQLGQEILFDELAELKEDFASLKSDFPLGKKRWYQRAAGIVVSYAGTKGADEIYEVLKPFLKDFFQNTAPHLIDKL
jgi:hypothetical protein